MIELIEATVIMGLFLVLWYIFIEDHNHGDNKS